MPRKKADPDPRVHLVGDRADPLRLAQARPSPGRGSGGQRTLADRRRRQLAAGDGGGRRRAGNLAGRRRQPSAACVLARPCPVPRCCRRCAVGNVVGALQLGLRRRRPRRSPPRGGRRRQARPARAARCRPDQRLSRRHLARRALAGSAPHHRRSTRSLGVAPGRRRAAAPRRSAKVGDDDQPRGRVTPLAQTVTPYGAGAASTG